MKYVHQRLHAILHSLIILNSVHWQQKKQTITAVNKAIEENQLCKDGNFVIFYSLY